MPVAPYIILTTDKDDRTEEANEEFHRLAGEELQARGYAPQRVTLYVGQDKMGDLGWLVVPRFGDNGAAEIDVADMCAGVRQDAYTYVDLHGKACSMGAKSQSVLAKLGRASWTLDAAGELRVYTDMPQEVTQA